MCSMADEQRRPSTRPRLSEDLIVTEALALAEEQGLDGMTLRPLGARLGVTAAALYGHVGSRGELIALMLARRIAEQHDARVPLAPDATWTATLRWTAEGMWDLYAPIPGLARESLAGRVSIPDTQEGAQDLVARIEADGLGPDEAARTAFTVVHWVLSFLAGLEHRPAEGERYADVPDRDPGTPRTIFDEGVELLVMGLQARQIA
jgi:AcrR family transcriptional regulator